MMTQVQTPRCQAIWRCGTGQMEDSELFFFVFAKQYMAWHGWHGIAEQLGR